MAYPGGNAQERGRSVPLLTALGFLLAALCDALAYVTIGPASGSAIISAMVAVFGIISLPSLISAPNVGYFRPIAPVFLLAIWQSALSAMLGVTNDGLQTLSALWMFVSILLVTSAFVGQAGAVRGRRWLYGVGWLVGGIYAVELIMGGLGAAGLVGRRSFALEALVLLSAVVPYAFDRTSFSARWQPYFLFALIAGSLSRTAMVVAAVLLVIRASFSRVGFRRGRFVFLGALSIAAGTVVVSSVPLLRERFLGGDQAFQFGGLSFSSQGRDAIWAVVLEGANRSPIIGQGPGSVKAEVSRLLPGIGEPHNDFLRVLYDSGWVGLALFVLGLLSLATATARRAFRARTLADAAPHTSALLAICAFVFACTTDNPLVYSFVLAPLAIIVGLSLREELPPKRDRKSQINRQSQSVDMLATHKKISRERRR